MVACVHCGVPAETELESIDSREDKRCASCSRTFTVGDAFQEVYENESRVKNSVDTVVYYATRKWTLKGDDEKARAAIGKILEHIKFEDLLKKTATDILVHGDAFLRTLDPGTKKTDWRLLPPHRVKVTTSWVSAQGSMPALKEERFDFNSESFQPEEIVHFKRPRFGWENTPYGESMIRIVLTPVYRLRDFRKSNAQSGLEWWREYLQEQIRYGLGVPDFVLERRPPEGTHRQFIELTLTNLIGKANELQELLSEGFNEALKRYANDQQLSEAPEIEFKRPTSRRVLIDCGFDFSGEGDRRAMIQQLRDIGIINQETCDRMLREYDDEIS
jgi:hypothetical protein